MPFSGGVWHDPQDELFKMWYHADYGNRHLCLATSQDGIRWSESLVRTGPTDDRNSAFWSPFRERWVHSIREYPPIGGLNEPKRCRRY